MIGFRMFEVLSFGMVCVPGPPKEKALLPGFLAINKPSL